MSARDILTVYENGKRKKKINTEIERDVWENKTQSFLCILGAIIGPGNVWRFPYIAYEYGGGAFLIPYIIFAVLCGFPLFFAEVALGQYTRQGAIGAWEIAPIMKGVGLGCAVLAMYSCCYYIVTMAWAILYFVHSFSATLPWMSCDNWWNTNSCLPYENISILNSNETAVYFSTGVANTSVALPIIEYWNNYILRRSSGLNEIGSLENWPMVLALLVSWILVYFSIFKGVKSSGKVAYVTATFPYLVMVILLIRSCMLDGAVDGIVYYLKPNLTKLQSPNVWIQAGSQVCYSYAICFAVLVALGSYNDFNRDCYKNSIVLVGCCSLTSFIVGFAVFAVLGNLSNILKVDIANVVSSGPGLAFVTYPIGLSLMPLPQLWNAMFFLMFISLVIDGQFTCLEGLITILCDFSATFKQRRELVSAVFCGVLFLSGLIFATEGGVYVFELFNNYAVSGIALMWLALMQSIGIAWVYGAEKFCDNIKEMIGYYPSLYFKLSLKYATPILTTFIMIFYMVKSSPLKVMGYVYPPSAIVIGWLLCMSSFLCVPGFAIYVVYKQRKTLTERSRKRIKPDHSDAENLEPLDTKM